MLPRVPVGPCTPFACKQSTFAYRENPREDQQRQLGVQEVQARFRTQFRATEADPRGDSRTVASTQVRTCEDSGCCIRLHKQFL